MPNSTIDDQDARVLYGGPWTHYRGDDGAYNASAWHGQSFSSCGGGGAGGGAKGPGCEVRVSFVGTSAALYGDSNGAHGQYACRVLDERGQPEGTWGWFDGGSRWWWPYQLNTLLCRVSGLPLANHTLVLDVQPDQVADGVALDYFTSTDEEPPGTAVVWRSDMNVAVPPQNYRGSTATPTLPSSTMSVSPAPSATSPSSGGVNKLAVGLGAGLGGFFAILSLLALGFYLYHRRRRERTRGVNAHEALGSYDADSNWYPEAGSVAGRLGESKGSPGKSPRAPKEGSYGYDGSPVSAYGYESSPASGYRYEGSPDGTFGYPGQSTFDSRTPFVYPAHSTSQFSFDAPAYPPLGASSSSAPLLTPVPLVTAPIPHDVRRASAAPSGYSSHNSRVSALLDLPPDAPLDDPHSFASR
ncbi:hypothetical protein JCM10449v2_004315 [Rhodotorula kratochvilovae]